jgi:hypothetical protein
MARQRILLCHAGPLCYCNKVSARVVLLAVCADVWNILGYVIHLRND